VVSDYESPKTNGLKLLEAVRERWPDLPFIILIGQGNGATVERALTAGATDFLHKRPDTDQFSELINRIRIAVAKHRAETEFERSAQPSEARFELLVETVEHYAIVLLDEEGYIRTWNQGAERIEGYTGEEVVGEHLSFLYREEDVKAGVLERVLQNARTKGSAREEGWRVRNDGSEIWADVTITALREEGELVGFAEITRESIPSSQERDLLERTEQLEELVAALSHDLRNPLAVAMGNVELALETGDLSRLEKAKVAYSRAIKLLDYLRKLVEEGSDVTDLEPVDLREITELTWDFVETREATLAVEGRLTLLADRQRLQQLLENLLRNAIVHAGPDVNVRLGPLEGTSGFYVADDGPGIPESERSEVFELGYSSDPEGSGFGLAICRAIAGAHGWFIEAVEGTDGGARLEVSNVEVA
jgi:PAS domain S-box-containing protein